MRERKQRHRHRTFSAGPANSQSGLDDSRAYYRPAGQTKGRLSILAAGSGRLRCPQPLSCRIYGVAPAAPETRWRAQRSKVELKRHLDLPRGHLQRRDLPESARSHARVRRRELGMIPKVEEFAAKLEVLGFGHREFLERREVPVIQPGPVESVRTTGAERAGSRYSERALAEPGVERSSRSHGAETIGARVGAAVRRSAREARGSGRCQRRSRAECGDSIDLPVA